MPGDGGRVSEQRSMDSLLNWGLPAEPDRLRDIDDASHGGADGAVPFATRIRRSGRLADRRRG
ncbi:hypothetical protein GCM10020219_044680 [Nonomuraea dietziae]